MPDFPIVDAHLHLWDPQHFAIPWLEGNATLNQRFTPAEYAEHTQGIAIEAMVYLEVDLDPHYALLEPRWVAERAKEDARIKAIVAHAPVEHGERARSFLDALVATSPLVRGVRRLLQGEPEVDFCLRPDFVRGVQLLAEYGLSFDILRPYVEHAIDVFGEDRVAFGGDWPVTLLASSYRRWVETLDELTAGLSEAARRKLWAENAKRFYRM